MKIAIFGTTYDSRHNQSLIDVVDVLIKNGVEVIFEQSFFDYVRPNVALPEVKNAHTDDIEVDIAISFGGDGTFLATSHKLAKKNIPILGINAGHLGFLADVSASEIEEVLVDVINGHYNVEPRVMLQMKLSSPLGGIYLALNEIAILRQDTSSMITLDVYIDSEFVNSYKSDGLLISTPTGSTAYSLSVGGPIVSPKSANFIVVPMAPHSLTVRPLIINDDCKIGVRVKSRSGNYQIAVDGYSIHLPESTSVFIEKAEYQIKSIQPQNHTFFKTLRNKLMWGADTRL